MVSRVAASPMAGEPNQPDSIHESVRRLLRWRYLVVAGVSVAAWVAIGSTSALAADRGSVHQSNTNTSTTAVDNNDGQSTGLLGGPIVAPVTLGVQTNATGPVNLNVLSNQANSGSGSSGVDQSNANSSTTVVDNHNAQSAGVISGPVVAPVSAAVQTNADGPVNANAGSDQAASGTGAGGSVSQSNSSQSVTTVDNANAQSAGVVAGPIVAPVTLGVQNNLEGPINGNVVSNQQASGNGADGELRQTNLSTSNTILDNQGAQSSGVVSGPVVVPVTPQVGTNVTGPADVNALSNQTSSGNTGGMGAGTTGGQCPPAGSDPQQVNLNGSTTLVDNRGAQSAAIGGVAGPIVAPISPQVGTNVGGPIDVNGGSNQTASGNGATGDVSQANVNGSFTMLDNQGAQSAAGGIVGVSGPVVAPIAPQVGTNVDGPVDGNLLSNQRDSGNGNTGGLEQVNANGSFAWLDNRAAQSTAGALGGVAVAGPVVAPISPQVGTNAGGPLDVNGASNQAASGSAGDGAVRQGNFNASGTLVDNRAAQSQASAAGLVGVGAAGPVLVPVSPQVGTNANGPVNGQLFSNQRDSGSGFGGDVEQLNANSSETFLNNAQAQAESFGGGVVGVAASGPIVAPISPQVGTNVNGPIDVQGFSNEDLSGNGNGGSGGDVRQSNLAGSLTWVSNKDAQSSSAAAGLVGAGGVAASGPIVAPISPQVGTNLNGPADANLFANQRDSGNANAGSLWQMNANSAPVLLDNDGAQSNSFAGSVGAIAGAAAISGPIVAPVSPQVGSNVNGPLDVNGAANQQASAYGNWGTAAQSNLNDSDTWVSNVGAQSNATALAGGVGLAGAGAGAISGPIVMPVSPQVGTNFNGPLNGNLLSNQRDSGIGNNGSSAELNANRSATWLDDTGAQSNASALAGAAGALGGADAAAVSGPIVAPIAGQVGTNLDGPLNVNGGSNQLDSGSGVDGDIHQLNWASTWTSVGNRGAQSNSFAGAAALGAIAGAEAGSAAVSGPIVAPIAPQVGTNFVGPANADLLSDQLASGNAANGTVDQANVDSAFTWLDNKDAQSNAATASGGLAALPVAASGAGALAGPVVAPITPQVGTNVNGPVNMNGFSNQLQSGSGGDIHQLNWNSSWTGLDDRDAQSNAFAGTAGLAGLGAGSGSLAFAGPFVAPVSPQVGTNATGPVNGNVVSNAQDSENGGSGPVDQLNGNNSYTWLDDGSAQSNAFGAALAGSLGASGAGSLAVAGPVVAPVAPQVGTNAAGPVNADAGSNDAASGNGGQGDVHQLNWQSAWTGVDNGSAQSNAGSLGAGVATAAGAGAVAASGPIVAPVTPQVGTNLNGPVNGNLVSNQDPSGSGNLGSVWQANVARSFTGLNDAGAQSDATGGAAALVVAGAGADAVSGPIVAPVSGQVGTNVNGPANVNVASGQADSGNGNTGDVSQLNWDGSWTFVDGMGAQSDASSLAAALGAGALSAAGPVVVPIDPQVGTNVDGPLNGNVFSDQRQSGNGSTGDPWQVNADQTWTMLDNSNAQSTANALSELGVAAAGPIVAPISPQVGTNANGPFDVNVASDQADSGNGSLGDVHQLNWNWSWSWFDNDGAQSQAMALIVPVAAAGPILAPVSPQVGTNFTGPADVDVVGNQFGSGNGTTGDIWQDNANTGLADLSSTGSSSFSDGLTGPAVVPVKADFDTNGDGPVTVNGGGNQQDSGNPGGAMNLGDMANAGALRNAPVPGGLAGILVAVVAGLTALASLAATRFRKGR